MRSIAKKIIACVWKDYQKECSWYDTNHKEKSIYFGKIKRKPFKQPPKDFERNSKILQKQKWMADNLSDPITPNIWPPKSPDLNPLDYYVQSVFEKEVNEHPHNTKDSLKAAIVRVMSGMNKEQLIKTNNRFWSRIAAVIDVSGGFIE